MKNRNYDMKNREGISYLPVFAGGGAFRLISPKALRFALAFLCFSFAFSSYADDIFVAPEGRGEMTGANWSNALNGSNDGFHIDVKEAIDTAVSGGATEVNVYFAGGTYSVTNQLSLSSITIPVKLSGGYLAETDGSLAKGETATTFSRTANNVRHVSATSLSALRIEGISFEDGSINESLAKGGAIYLSASSTVVSNCVFRRNCILGTTAFSSGIGGGGAVASVGGGSLELCNSQFDENHQQGGQTSSVAWGGAVYANTVDLTITSCSFNGNYLDCKTSKVYFFGAAVGTYKGNVTVSNCSFGGNYLRSYNSDSGNGVWAGALAIRNASSFRMTDSIVTNCYAASKLKTQWHGGLMLLDDFYASDGVMTSVVERCVFDASGVPSSVAPANGTGSISVRSDIVVLGGHLCMTNCLVARLRGNSYADGAIAIRCGQVGRASGAAYSYHNSNKHTAARSSAEIVNCSIADCARPGVFRQVNDTYVTELSLENSIVYGNTGTDVGNATTIAYCCLQEVHEGEGNFVPESVEALNWTGAPYYHLLTKKANGAITNGWFSGTYESARTAADSPCIDAGSAGFPVGLEPEPNGRRMNLGAYGGTQWASMTSGAIGLVVVVK